MSKELTKKEEMEVVPMDSQMFGEESGITMEDIAIGRISIQQALSQLVAKAKTRPGDIVNILTEEVLGDAKKPVEFVVIKAFKYWIEKEGDNFKGRFPAKSQHELAWEEGTIKRVYHHSFYVLLTSEMKDGFAMPLELPFRSTELASSRKLSSFIAKMWMMKRPTWSQVFTLTSEPRSKDKYNWNGSNINLGRKATKEEMDMAAMWNTTLKTASVTHTEEDENPPAPPAQTTEARKNEDSSYTGQF